MLRYTYLRTSVQCFYRSDYYGDTIIIDALDVLNAMLPAQDTGSFGRDINDGLATMLKQESDSYYLNIGFWKTSVCF